LDRRGGVERTVLASDLGQAGNPLPREGLRRVASRLLERGLAAGDIRRLVATNPSQVLGLNVRAGVDSL
jgi:hypothetical protein